MSGNGEQEDSQQHLKPGFVADGLAKADSQSKVIEMVNVDHIPSDGSQPSSRPFVNQGGNNNSALQSQGDHTDLNVPSKQSHYEQQLLLMHQQSLRQVEDFTLSDEEADDSMERDIIKTCKMEVTLTNWKNEMMRQGSNSHRSDQMAEGAKRLATLRLDNDFFTEIETMIRADYEP